MIFILFIKFAFHHFYTSFSLVGIHPTIIVTNKLSPIFHTLP